VAFQDLSGVVYGLGSAITENVMVAANSSSGIWYTTSGKSWSQVTIGTNQNLTLQAVAWNGVMWVVAGNTTTNGVIYYSSDGLIWIPAIFNILTSIKSVAWNGSIWIVVGTNSANNNVIAASKDGINWYDPGGNLSAIISFANTVAWSGTKWLVGGENAGAVIASSTDGETWIGSYTDSTAGAQILTVANNGPYWLGGGTNGVIIYSSNGGSSWDEVTSATFAGYTITNLAWNGTVWVATANNTTTARGILAYSTKSNGSTWVLGYTFQPSGQAYSLAWNGSSWYASGARNNTTYQVVSSQDGINWDPITNTPTNRINAIASRRSLPYIGEVLNTSTTAPVAPTNQALSFTIYLAYSDANTISGMYIPPGLLKNFPSGGTYSAGSFPVGVSTGPGTLTLENTSYAALIGMYGQGYQSAGWRPIQYIGSTNYPSYSVTVDANVYISNLGLTLINGGNIVPPLSGFFTGYVVTLTLTYLTDSLVLVP